MSSFSIQFEFHRQNKTSYLEQVNETELGPGFRFSAGTGMFMSPSPHPDLFGTHQVSCQMDKICSFPGLKRPGREADHSPAFSAEFNNA